MGWSRQRASRRLALGALWLSGLVLAGCSRAPARGPAPIAWDRDACERCQMAIGDRRFAVEIREVGGALHKFDDPGCALLWLDEHPGADAPGREIWVRTLSGNEWLPGASVGFVDGAKTPMGYGFAAEAQPPAGALGLDELRARVRAREDARRSHDR